MKKLILILVSTTAFSLVGINTVTPQGSFDINVINQGLIPPKAVLTSLSIANPVVNPQGGNLANGTVIYNSSGTLEQGLYFWDGTKWNSTSMPSYYVEYIQNANLSTSTANNYNQIPGLNNNLTVPYDGSYLINLRSYIGCPRPNNGNDPAYVEGTFELNVSSISNTKYSHSESFQINSTNTYLYQLFNETNITYRVVLSKGQIIPIIARYKPISQSNLSVPNHIVGLVGSNIGNPCIISVQYIGK